MQSLTDLRSMILATRGKIFSVIFTKKNGDSRQMVCRLGVASHLKGGEKNFSDEEKGLVTVFDMEAGAYRSINLSTLKSFTFQGKTFNVPSIPVVI